MESALPHFPNSMEFYTHAAYSIRLSKYRDICSGADPWCHLLGICALDSSISNVSESQQEKMAQFCLLPYPVGRAVPGLLAAVLLTITYLNAAVWGSGVGGAAGLAVAIVPGLALTLFSEFYRDWFLTRIIGMDDGKKKDKQPTIKKKKSTRRKQEGKTENTSTEEGLQAETRTDQVTIELQVIDNPATQNGGDRVKNGKVERQTHATEDNPEIEEELAQEEEVEEEEVEEKVEKDDGIWNLRRSTEPAHFLTRGFSRIYNSSRRKKD